jgi:hypothetical protein
MTEKAKAMYEVFCAARAESRATEEGAAKVAEFHEVGKESAEAVDKFLKDVEKETEAWGGEAGPG